jgi:tetratricopeptide (TPR) repeat protein
MQFYQKALESSKLCGDKNQHGSVLLRIATCECATGGYSAAWVHASDAQQLSKLSVNLYQEAKAHQVGAVCSLYYSDYPQSVAQLHRAREILDLCGLGGGTLDHDSITLRLAEVHLLKSEYLQARDIHRQIVETTSPEKNAGAYATALLNIAQINITIGQITENVDRILTNAKNIFSSTEYLRGITLCNVVQADKELRDENFHSAKVKFEESVFSGKRDSKAESFCLERLANVIAWPGMDSTTHGQLSTWGMPTNPKRNWEFTRHFSFLEMCSLQTTTKALQPISIKWH